MKLFYTPEEAAEKLGLTVDEVNGLSRQGKLQPFHYRDEIIFKREQVDSLLSDQDVDVPYGQQHRTGLTGGFLVCLNRAGSWIATVVWAVFGLVWFFATASGLMHCLNEQNWIGAIILIPFLLIGLVLLMITWAIVTVWVETAVEALRSLLF